MEGGIFSANAAADTRLALASEAKAERVFLELFNAYEGEGRKVSPNPGHTYAPAQFSKDPRAEGITKAALTHAMNRLFASGRLRSTQYGPPSRVATKIERVAEEPCHRLT